jgi:hypothetical protein
MLFMVDSFGVSGNFRAMGFQSSHSSVAVVMLCVVCWVAYVRILRKKVMREIFGGAPGLWFLSKSLLSRAWALLWTFMLFSPLGLVFVPIRIGWVRAMNR